MPRNFDLRLTPKPLRSCVKLQIRGFSISYSVIKKEMDMEPITSTEAVFQFKNHHTAMHTKLKMDSDQRLP